MFLHRRRRRRCGDGGVASANANANPTSSSDDAKATIRIAMTSTSTSTSTSSDEDEDDARSEGSPSPPSPSHSFPPRAEAQSHRGVEFRRRRSGGNGGGGRETTTTTTIDEEDDEEDDDDGMDDATAARCGGATMTSFPDDDDDEDDDDDGGGGGGGRSLAQEVRRLESLNATLASNLAILARHAFGGDDDDDDDDDNDDNDDHDDDKAMKGMEGGGCDDIIDEKDVRSRLHPFGGRRSSVRIDANYEDDDDDDYNIDGTAPSSSSSTEEEEERRHHLRRMEKLERSNDALRRKLHARGAYVTRLLRNLKIAADRVRDMERERDEWKIRYETKREDDDHNDNANGNNMTMTTTLTTAMTTMEDVSRTTIIGGDATAGGGGCAANDEGCGGGGGDYGKRNATNTTSTSTWAVECGLIELLRLVRENEMARDADRAYLLRTHGDDDDDDDDDGGRGNSSTTKRRTDDDETIDEILNRISRELRGEYVEGNDHGVGDVGSDRACITRMAEGVISPSTPPPPPPPSSPMPSGREDVEAMIPSGKSNDQQRRLQHPPPTQSEMKRENFVDVDEHPMCREIKSFDRSALRRTLPDRPDHLSFTPRPFAGDDVSFIAESVEFDDANRGQDVDLISRDIDHNGGGCDTCNSIPILGPIRRDEEWGQGGGDVYRDRYDAIGDGIVDDSCHINDYDIELPRDDGWGNDDAECYEDIGDVVDRKDDVHASLEANDSINFQGGETTGVKDIIFFGGSVEVGKDRAMHRETPNNEAGEESIGQERSIEGDDSLSKDEMTQREFPAPGKSDDDTDTVEDLVDGLDESDVRLAFIERDDSRDVVEIEEESRFLFKMREDSYNDSDPTASTVQIVSDPSSNEGNTGSMCRPEGEDDTTAAIVGEFTEQIRDYGSDYDDDEDGMYNAREPKGEDIFQQQLLEKIDQHSHTGFIAMETMNEENNYDHAFSSGADNRKGGSDDNEKNDADSLHQESFGKTEDHLNTGCIAEETKDESNDDVHAFSGADNGNNSESNEVDEADAKVETSQCVDNLGSLIQTEMPLPRSVNHDATAIVEENKELNPSEEIILEENPKQLRAISTDDAPCIEVITGSEEKFSRNLVDTLERIQEQSKARLDVKNEARPIAYCEHIEAHYTKPISTKAGKENPFFNRLSRRKLFQRNGSLEMILDVAKESFLSPRERQILVVSKDNDKYLVPRYGPPLLPPQTSKTGAPIYKKGQKDSGYYIYISSSGNKYAGNFKAGTRHGYGIATYHDGEVFNGEWRRGRRHGRGVLHLANREVFDGTWSANKKHGLGVYYWTDGEVDISWYEDNTRLKSLRWTRDRRRAYSLDLTSPKKEPISLDRAASIVQDWERKHSMISANVQSL